MFPVSDCTNCSFCSPFERLRNVPQARCMLDDCLSVVGIVDSRNFRVCSESERCARGVRCRRTGAIGWNVERASGTSNRSGADDMVEVSIIRGM